MTLGNSSQLIALLLLLGTLAWLLLWRRRPGRRVTARKIRHPGPWFQLVELKALAVQRVAHLRDAQLTLLTQEETSQPNRPGQGWCTRDMVGKWIRFRLRLQPPDERPWWPVGLTVECPEFLALRDALPQSEPIQDPIQAVRSVLHLQLQCFVEGSSDCLRGNQEISLVAYVPESCQELEIGYYGHPLLRLFRSRLGKSFQAQNPRLMGEICSPEA